MKAYSRASVILVGVGAREWMPPRRVGHTMMEEMAWKVEGAKTNTSSRASLAPPDTGLHYLYIG